MYEYRCDERVKVKNEGSTRLAYTKVWLVTLLEPTVGRIVVSTAAGLMTLLHPNKKRREPGETVSRLNYDALGWESDKALKMSAHHVPLSQMIQTKRYVRWADENRYHYVNNGASLPITVASPVINKITHKCPEEGIIHCRRLTGRQEDRSVKRLRLLRKRPSGASRCGDDPETPRLTVGRCGDVSKG
jgi:hypothetical protein